MNNNNDNDDQRLVTIKCQKSQVKLTSQYDKKMSIKGLMGQYKPSETIMYQMKSQVNKIRLHPQVK